MTFRTTQAVVLGATMLLAGCKMPGSTVSEKIKELGDQVAQCEADADALPAEPGDANTKRAADLYERAVRADNLLARYNRMGGAFRYADFDEMKRLRPRVDSLRSRVAAKLKAVAGGDADRLQKEIEARNPSDTASAFTALSEIKKRVTQCEAEANALPAEPGEANATRVAELYGRVIRADNALARNARLSGATTPAELEERNLLRRRVEAVRSSVLAKLKAVAAKDAERLQKEIEAKNPPDDPPATKR